MRIGIDIDGVLNSQYDFCIEYGTKFCNKLGKYKLENLAALSTTNMFLWEDDVAHQFWNKYRKKLVMDLPAKDFASEIIKKLKDEDNEIYIITARKNNDEWFPNNLKCVEKITKRWLQKNKIYYDKIFFNVKDKGVFCKENNIDIMIEDDPINLTTLVGNTHVMVFDYPYNRQNEFNNLIRVYNWHDIYNIIKSNMINR